MKSKGKINAVVAIKGIISRYKYLALNQIFAKLYDKIDSILISSYMTAASLGVYSVGYAFFSNYGVVSNAISVVYLPHYSKGSASHNKNQLKIILLEGLFVTTAIGGIVSGFLFILAPFVISTFFGDRYLGAVVVAKILSLGGILMLLSHNCGNFVNSIERTKITLFAAITAFVFNICANIYFIPLYGIVAAAVITICTEGLNVVILLAYIIYFFSGSNEDLSYR
jgi:O-antigen/teichoic acid export membrane protein